MTLNRAEELRNKFWQQDIQYNNGLIWKQYNQIKKVLNDIDMNWVNERLMEIKSHAIKSTSYYKDMDVNGVFPVVNKATLLENYEEHMAVSGFDLPIHKSSTSGSTGTPFTVIQDYKKRMRTIADLKVFGELCNYPSHERMIFFRVLSKNNRAAEQEEAENIFYIDSSNLNELNLNYMAGEINKKKPRIILGYSSTIVELAKYICGYIDNYRCTLTSVLAIGEGLEDCDRKLVEKVFNCKVYRRYSDMELGILGQDSGDGGKYFLNWGSYFFEVLKLEKDEPAGEGELGRIVITDLFNKAFPMIRYDTGDLGILECTDRERFPYLREIYGRKRDCVYTTNGSLVSPAKISVSMWGCKNVRQWQFIQTDKATYILKINPYYLPYEDKDMVYKLRTVLGFDAEIKVELVSEIPVLSSNKRRAVICEIK